MIYRKNILFLDNHGKKENGDNKRRAGGLAACVFVLAAMLGANGCEREQPPWATFFKIIVSGDAVETLSGAPLSGSVRFVGKAFDLDSKNRPYLRDYDVVASFGTPVELGFMPIGQSAEFKMTYVSPGALTKIFESVQMQGTKNFHTDMLDLNNFDWLGFWNMPPGRGIPLNNMIKRLDESALAISFNPDMDSGERLSGEWMNECKRVWDKIKSESNHVINKISYIDMGNYRRLDPCEKGHVRIFRDSRNSVPVSETFQDNDGSVNGIFLMYNPDAVSLEQVEAEIMNSLYQGNQIFGTTEKYWKYVRFTFKRPAGNHGYNIFLDREVFDFFSGTINSSTNTAVFLSQEMPQISLIPGFEGKESGYTRHEMRIPENEKTSKEDRKIRK